MSDTIFTPRDFQNYPLPTEKEMIGVGMQIRTRYFFLRGMQDNIHEPKLCVISVVQPEVSKEYSWHRHLEYELILPLGESYRCMLNGKDVSLNRDEALLIEPNDIHQDYLSPTRPYIAFLFNLRKSDEQGDNNIRIFRTGTVPSKKVVHLSERSEADDLLRLLRQELLRHPGGVFSIVSSLFLVIFHLVVEDIEKDLLADDAPPMDTQDELLYHQINEAFQLHCTSNINVAGLCAKLGMSPATLSRYCHKLFGMSPKQAFMRHKIDTARFWMSEHPGTALKTLSQRMGFKDQFHFSKCFKRMTGVAPQEYFRDLQKKKKEQ